MSTIKLVLSRHLALESVSADGFLRTLANTLTGQRLEVSTEVVTILESFRSPCTVTQVSEALKIQEEDYFNGIIQKLFDVSFLVEASGYSEQLAFRRIVEENPFSLPKIAFAHCPSVNIESVESGSMVIAGICYDQATTGNPGTRYGPDSLRESSCRFTVYDRDIFTLKNKGWYLSDLDKTILQGTPFFDVGNVISHVSEDTNHLYDRCHTASLLIQEKGGLPIFFGGDHSISAPLVNACKEFVGSRDVVVVQFDAHTDLADWDPSVAHHHGNVMTRILGENPGLELYQLGVRGFAGSRNLNKRCRTITQEDLNTEPYEVIMGKLPKGKKCYVSIDVDVLDPSVAPGVGTPVPMGMQPITMISILGCLARSNQIIGVDVVELCPGLDNGNRTSDLVFHILMRFLGSI